MKWQIAFEVMADYIMLFQLKWIIVLWDRWPHTQAQRCVPFKYISTGRWINSYERFYYIYYFPNSYKVLRSMENFITTEILWWLWTTLKVFG